MFRRTTASILRIVEDHPVLFAGAVILVAVLLMYHYFLTPPLYPKIFGTYDYCRYFGPQAYFLDSAIHHGEFPLWNPLAFCGMPFAASPQQTAFYPPDLIRSLLTFHPTPFKTHVGLALLMVFHMLVAGLGTFALAREYRLSRSASLVAALAYIFGPHFVRRVMEQWILVAVAAWLPLLLFLVRRAMHSATWRVRICYASAAGLTFGISTLGGFPQLTFYTVIAVGMFWLLERSLAFLPDFRARARARNPVSVECSDYDDEHEHERESPRSILSFLASDLFVLSVLFVLGAAVAMTMLLPAAEFIHASARVKSNGLEVNAAPQDLSAKHLLQSMVVYPGATFAEQGCRAAGLGALFLAVASIMYRRKRDVVIYGILYLILTDCTLGPPFPFGRIVNALDIFQFSSPWRAGILAGLPFAMLAGFGLDGVTREVKSRGWNLARSALLLIIGALAIHVLFKWYHLDLQAMLVKGTYFQVPKAVLFVPMATLATIILAGWLPFPGLWRSLTLALVFIEMLIWNTAYFPAFIAWSGYKDKPEIVAGADAIPCDNVRWPDPAPNTLFYTLKPAMNGYDPVCLSRARQFLCAPMREKLYYRNLKDWEVTSENQRGNLFLKRPFWLARQYVNAPLPGKDALFPPTTTVFIRDAGQLPVPELKPADVAPHAVSADTEKVPVADAAALATVVKPQGRASFRAVLPAFSTGKRHAALCMQYSTTDAVDVGISFRDLASDRTQFGKHYKIQPGGVANVLEYPVPDFDNVEATLTWKSSHPNNPIKLEDAYVLQDLDDENSLIHIQSWRANSVDLDIADLPASRILLFTDVAYPGWRAYVDASPAPIYTADDLFKAIVVPSGTHHVRFVFSSWRVCAGIGISLLSIGGIIAILITLPRRGRRDP